MATYVLVHGAWSGAHGFRHLRTRSARRPRGVHAQPDGPRRTGPPPQPPGRPPTHVRDVVNQILYEDLDDIVLLGFSYGGMVVTGCLDSSPTASPPRLPRRLRTRRRRLPLRPARRPPRRSLDIGRDVAGPADAARVRRPGRGRVHQPSAHRPPHRPRSPSPSGCCGPWSRSPSADLHPGHRRRRRRARQRGVGRRRGPDEGIRRPGTTTRSPPTTWWRATGPTSWWRSCSTLSGRERLVAGGQVVEGLLAVALERRAVHEGERAGSRSPSARMVEPCAAAKQVAWNIASASSAGPTMSSLVSAGPLADMGEEVAAQQRARGLLEQHLRLPPVGDVRVSRSDAPACHRGRSPRRPRAAAAAGRTCR